MPEIDTNAVYKQLKKQNGEAAARVIRDAVLLDVPNIVHILEFAGNNPDEVRQLVPVIREIYKTRGESQYHTDKNPLELLSDAGYDAFVVKTEEQKDSIKKYFRPNEELCTFRDPTRHKYYYMIHAIKRGADKIKPSDNPERQDEYGTSVISIQIAKTGGFISIKNRYNHTVANPDNTFDSNPDKIIPGLVNSLKKYFNVDFNALVSEMPDNFRMVNDQLVRYNYEVDNVYVGSNFYVRGSTITKINTDYEIMLCLWVLNTKNGQIGQIPGIDYSPTCARKYLSDAFSGKRIVVQKSSDGKDDRDVFADCVKIAAVDKGQIIKLNLPDVTEIENDFSLDPVLQEINLPNVEKIGDEFLSENKGIKHIGLPKVITIGDGFLADNKNLDTIDIPMVQEIGSRFLTRNESLTSLNAPNLQKIGTSFLRENESLTLINLPNVTKIGCRFFSYNNCLKSIELPNVTEIGEGFLQNNKSLMSMNIPKISPNDNPDIKRLQFVVANNKLKEKQPMPVNMLPQDMEY